MPCVWVIDPKLSKKESELMLLTEAAALTALVAAEVAELAALVSLVDAADAEEAALLASVGAAMIADIFEAAVFTLEILFPTVLITVELLALILTLLMSAATVQTSTTLLETVVTAVLISETVLMLLLLLFTSVTAEAIPATVVMSEEIFATVFCVYVSNRFVKRILMVVLVVTTSMDISGAGLVIEVGIPVISTLPPPTRVALVLLPPE